MPPRRKVILNKIPIFVTTSMQLGLPMVPTKNMNVIVESILGRAQSLYPIQICGIVNMANHTHMIITVDNPSDLPNFMKYYKAELAHAINQMMGFEKRSVWCEGYDSPLLLTVNDVIEKLVYTYTNPAKDGLVDSIDQYPGINTWDEFQNNGGKRNCAWIRRKAIKQLPHSKLSIKQQDSLAKTLRAGSKISHKLTIDPNAWMRYFGITSPEQIAEINAEIKAKVIAKQAEFQRQREMISKLAAGSLTLVTQPIDKPFVPERTGIRTYCICSDIFFRSAFINFLKELISLAEEWYRRALRLDFSVQFPIGLFRPALPRRGEFITRVSTAW